MEETHRPKLRRLLAHRPRDSTSLHLALRIHNLSLKSALHPRSHKPLPSQVYTYHPSIILEIQEHPVRAPPRLTLPHNHRRHDFLPQLWFTLLYGRHHHVAYTTSGEAVEARADAFDGDDVEVAGAGVVCAVHDGAAGGMLVS